MDCAPANCRWRCALDVIDELIAQPHLVSGGEVDRLLDLRWKLSQRCDAEDAMRTFCDLRVEIERRHYLAFFRIRRWLENHLVASVRPAPEEEPRYFAVKLDHYCVEAIRRASLCAVLRGGMVLSAPRLRFEFRAMPETVRALSRSSADAGLLMAPGLA